MSHKTATHVALWVYTLLQLFLNLTASVKSLDATAPGNVAYVAAGVIALPAFFWVATLVCYGGTYWSRAEGFSNRALWVVYPFFAAGALQVASAVFAAIPFFEDPGSVRKAAVVYSRTVSTSGQMLVLALAVIYVLPLRAFPVTSFEMQTAPTPEARYRRVF